MKKHIVRWSILFAVGVALGLVYTYREVWNGQDKPAAAVSATVKTRDVNTGGAQIGGPFTLTDQNGNTVTDKDYAGQYKLIFFGFASCPMVCPTELQKMALVLDELGETGDKIQPIFITVDPERDDVESMKVYVEQFHPRLVGLTGTREQIDPVMKAYKVYATKVEMKHNAPMEGHEGHTGHEGHKMDMDQNDYMINHSAYTYLMAPDGELVAIYPEKDTATEIVEDIKRREL